MARLKECRPLDEQKDRAACTYRWIESGEERTKTCRYSRYANDRRGWFSPFRLPAACSVGTNATIRDGQNLACERNFVGKCADAPGQGVPMRLRSAHTVTCQHQEDRHYFNVFGRRVDDRRGCDQLASVQGRWRTHRP